MQLTAPGSGDRDPLLIEDTRRPAAQGLDIDRNMTRIDRVEEE
ncbi:hypothetical protein HNQ81_000994 [Desulfoprunum benzoelyticum]|uniref:Uncharacterized protein n=1 Tax=Desulfoprunum benzoelyticum TaxID=1506996 RepID=A0A840V2A8_9BACT|nr:hypothetical protein [Desulfoprunum benzoelyticum]MBB5347281.1 hypothetical protein [Desulfoprunum benzoelyticum]